MVFEVAAVLGVSLLASVAAAAIVHRMALNYRPFLPVKRCQHTYLAKDFGTAGRLLWCPKCDPMGERAHVLRVAR